jgi:HPt (histidine-containing phosphotransfer) domain-containing protein
MAHKEYNWDFFKESANGDVKFMKYILNLTASELRRYFDQLIYALQKGQIEQAKRAQHKLKPHLEALQASELAMLISRTISDSDNISNELLQAFQQKAMLLCDEILQAANDER